MDTGLRHNYMKAVPCMVDVENAPARQPVRSAKRVAAVVVETVKVSLVRACRRPTGRLQNVPECAADAEGDGRLAC